MQTDMKSAPGFRALAFYSTTVESGHVQFASEAIRFYTKLAAKQAFTFESTTDWTRLLDPDISSYDVIVWLNDFPKSAEERTAFERYMQTGGTWLGFHVSGYNDRHTGWPWFVDLMGGAVFYSNNWPPLPADLVIDDPAHPVMAGLPGDYTAPADEWYQWKPSPRLDPDVRVLATLSPSNYPLGQKNLLTEGDIPVVWTNTRFNMLYVNMGHCGGLFELEIQSRLFENALLWLGRDDRKVL